MKLEQLADIGNISKKNFPHFGRPSTKSKPFFIHHPAAINQKPIMMSLLFFSLLKMSTEMIKLIDRILLSLYQNHKKT